MSVNKRAFRTVEQGHWYEIPNYKVVEGKGIEETGTVTTIGFVRGSKVSGENKSEPKEGTLHEHLLSMMIEDLKFKYDEYPSEETKNALQHLKEAQRWLEERVLAREAAGVLGTYQPHKS
jgi:hypothetical protein